MEGHPTKTWHSASDQLCLVVDDPSDDDERLRAQAKAGNFLKECVLAQRHYDRGEYVEAHKHYTAAGARGTQAAQYNAAILTEHGRGTEASLEEAMHLYQRVARRGSREAKFRLGYHLTQTDEVAQGVKYIREAADGGSAPAMFEYGMMFLHGVSVDEDVAVGTDWRQRSVEAGYVRAAFALAIHYSRPSCDEREMELAVKMASHAAGEGHSLAQDLLGQFYLMGIGVEPDVHMAFECFLAASSQGVLSSKRDLGILLEAGRGCDQDVSRSVDLFRECSDAGDSTSLFRLALLHARGAGGLAVDLKLGRKMMRESADADCIAAQAYLISKELVDEDQVRLLKAKLASTAANAQHPNHTAATRALVGLGLIPSCRGCGISKVESPTPLMECGRCNSVKYCSSACQTADWNRHRSECKNAEKE